MSLASLDFTVTMISRSQISVINSFAKYNPIITNRIKYHNHKNKTKDVIIGSCVKGVQVPALLYNVPLQHGFLGQNASEAEGAQVQCFKVPIQDQFCHSAAHSGGVLQAVAAETGGKVHIVDQWVHTDDAVLVKSVVVVETRPRAGHLKGRNKREQRAETTSMLNQN